MFDLVILVWGTAHKREQAEAQATARNGTSRPKCGDRMLDVTFCSVVIH